VPENSLKVHCFDNIHQAFTIPVKHLSMICLFSLLIFSPHHLFCQTVTGQISLPDSVVEKEHSPTKATIMSLCLPGLGQIYNKKVWKVPIIYTGFGILTYFIVTNANQYSTYRGAYIAAVNKDTTSKYEDLINKYSPEDLLAARDYYRRNLEVTCLLTALFYILNVLDATVDAHLFTYNISKDLSLKLDPVMISPVYTRNFSSGIRVCLKF
jgi:hypothetical protein